MPTIRTFDLARAAVQRMGAEMSRRLICGGGRSPCSEEQPEPSAGR